MEREKRRKGERRSEREREGRTERRGSGGMELETVARWITIFGSLGFVEYMA